MTLLVARRQPFDVRGSGGRIFDRPHGAVNVHHGVIPRRHTRIDIPPGGNVAVRPLKDHERERIALEVPPLRIRARDVAEQELLSYNNTWEAVLSALVWRGKDRLENATS